ncbi:MAG: response regulator transcription factor [Patescibacteria group bacterium]
MGHERSVTPEEARWKATIFVATPQELLNQGLKRVLEEGDIQVIGLSLDATPIGEMVKKTQPDVLLVGRGLPGLHIPILALQTKNLPTKIIVLGSTFDPRELGLYERFDVRHVASTLDTQEDLVRTILGAKNGIIYKSPRVASAYALIDKHEHTIETLTPREAEVLALLSLGHTNLEVAGILRISVKTAETHRSRILGKTGTITRAELTAMAPFLTITYEAFANNK